MLGRVDRWLRARWFPYMKRRAYQNLVRGVDASRTPIIVFQMGKVGSSSIVKTLSSHLGGHQIFQVHFLTRPWMKRVENEFRQASRVRGRAFIDRHVLESRYLIGQLEASASGKPWKVISMVRDPVARNVSAFFQAFPVYFAREHHNGGGGMAELDSDQLLDLFINQFGADRHAVPLTWFQREVEPTFGIDVFQEPFDTARGYQIYRNSRCELLVLRMEDLDRVASAALQEFLGFDVPSQVNSNRAEDKDYADVYREFRSRLVLPKAYLDQMYESTYATQFYSPEELLRFRSRWIEG